MAVEVHAEPLKRRFIADWCSIACLLNLLVLLGAAILPLYISWASSLWIRDKLMLEQLDVQLNNHLVVEVSGLRGPIGQQLPYKYCWSSSPVANSLYGSQALFPLLARWTPVDVNGDGLMDEGSLALEIPLAADQTLYDVLTVAFGSARVHVSGRAVYCVHPRRCCPLTHPPSFLPPRRPAHG